MTLSHQNSPITLKDKLTYREATETIQEINWQNIGSINVEQACLEWLSKIENPRTRTNYRSGIGKLFEIGLINPFMNFKEFALLNQNNIIDHIKQITHWSECTRQARAACYISFTEYWRRKTDGIIKKATPKKTGKDKTFVKVHTKVKTKAMNQPQWIRFLEELYKINKRDHLIARIILQGAKRVQEVLTLNVNQIRWESNQIDFIQSKTGRQIKTTVITYPESLMDDLKIYLGERSGIVFITRFNRKVDLRQLAITFAKASENAKVPFKVTPHVLRATCITYLSNQGFADSDIIKVSGHYSMEMVRAYDKTSEEENATKKVFLIS